MPSRYRLPCKASLVVLLLSLGIPAWAQEPVRTAGSPYRVGGDVSRPEILSSTKPSYTEIARRARVTGTVIVEAVIDENGNATEARVLKGLPMGLDRTALEAIKNWKFKPATMGGRPVAVYYVLTVNFQLQDDANDYGPTLAKLVKENPDFAEPFLVGDYEKAAQVLDRWEVERPGDSEIAFARTYLFLRQGLLNAAWREALSYHGPEPYEILHGVGLLALRVASPQLQGEGAEIPAEEAIELGLQAETMAIAAKPDEPEALARKSRLLWQKAQMTRDPKQRQALLDEADQLKRMADELEQKWSRY